MVIATIPGPDTWMVIDELVRTRQGPVFPGSQTLLPVGDCVAFTFQDSGGTFCKIKIDGKRGQTTP